jgi:prophage regulatory protein
MHEKPTDALVRIGKIVGPNGLIPVSRSAFYQGIRDGIYPRPVRLGKRTSAWRMSELMHVVQKEAIAKELEQSRNTSETNAQPGLHQEVEQ